MTKTTIYLPKSLKKAVARAATARGVSEASVIRQAIEQAMRDVSSPRPRLPLFRSRGRSRLADRVDQGLRGDGGPSFGER